MKMNVSILIASLVICSGAMADEVTHHTLWQGQDHRNHCYASDQDGNTPDDSAPTTRSCCDWSSGIGAVVHHTISLGEDNRRHCYASDQNGNTPGGSPSTASACCTWN